MGWWKNFVDAFDVPPAPPDNSAMSWSANPIVINPTHDQKIALAVARMDAIRAHINQNSERVTKDRLREFLAETTMHCELLRRAGLLSDEDHDKAIRYVMDRL